MSTTWTLSPTSTLISGAGTTPLYVHALTTMPGSTSQSVIAAVSSNRFVPSVQDLGLQLLSAQHLP